MLEVFVEGAADPGDGWWGGDVFDVAGGADDDAVGCSGDDDFFFPSFGFFGEVAAVAFHAAVAEAGFASAGVLFDVVCLGGFVVAVGGAAVGVA